MGGGLGQGVGAGVSACVRKRMKLEGLRKVGRGDGRWGWE